MAVVTDDGFVHVFALLGKGHFLDAVSVVGFQQGHGFVQGVRLYGFVVQMPVCQVPPRLDERPKIARKGNARQHFL